jgi:hypothetical protein
MKLFKGNRRYKEMIGSRVSTEQLKKIQKVAKKNKASQAEAIRVLISLGLIEIEKY